MNIFLSNGIYILMLEFPKTCYMIYLQTFLHEYMKNEYTFSIRVWRRFLKLRHIRMTQTTQISALLVTGQVHCFTVSVLQNTKNVEINFDQKEILCYPALIYLDCNCVQRPLWFCLELKGWQQSKRPQWTSRIQIQGMQVILNNAEGIDDSDDNTYCEIFR